MRARGAGPTRARLSRRPAPGPTLRLLLLVNSSASSVTPRTRVVIRRALAADHQVRYAETTRRGHASRLAQAAATDGLDAVVVLGGDGTVNEAANGLVGTTTGLGVLPGGSTNVFARAIGMAADPVEATGELLASLSEGPMTPIQVGEANGRYFLFHLGAGFDAAVVAEVEKRAAAKRYLGAALFVASAAATWAFRVERRDPWFSLRRLSPTRPGEDRGAGPEADRRAGPEADRRAAPAQRGGPSLPPPAAMNGRDAGVDGAEGGLVICLNTGPYTYLGTRPLDLLPGHRVLGGGASNGLGVVVFERISLPSLLAVTLSALRGSRQPLLRSSRVRSERAVEAIELVARRPLPYQVDGDYLGEAERIVVRCVPDALRLVLPPGARMP